MNNVTCDIVKVSTKQLKVQSTLYYWTMVKESTEQLKVQSTL